MELPEAAKKRKIQLDLVGATRWKIKIQPVGAIKNSKEPEESLKKEIKVESVGARKWKFKWEPVRDMERKIKMESEVAKRRH
ncbi:unnamed protein product [Orchesella dallaii]|uniref:Uncharacterized protein n=1 Tax=Orchesella dallaii TaxID=48710 RepID=A0ABP1R1I0_9HEXA